MRDARLAWLGLAIAAVAIAAIAVVTFTGHHHGPRRVPHPPIVHLPRNLPPAGAMF